jgi:hypothetical protein
LPELSAHTDPHLLGYPIRVKNLQHLSRLLSAIAKSYESPSPFSESR